MNLKYALVLAAMVVSATVFADDKDKPKKETRPVVVTTKTTEVKVERKKGGNSFTRFWTDDVGGTIYHGLKKGSNKVANTFD